MTHGLLALALLLLSRVLGLLRESLQAAALGHTALADSVVVMMTLPDAVSTVLAAGGLSYVLLPLWAQHSAASVRQHQREIARLVLLWGSALTIVLFAAAMPLGAYLAPAAAAVLPQSVQQALYWGAIAVPLALLSSLWWTRLQHERDVIGLYGVNAVHNLVVIVALLGVMGGAAGSHVITWLGLALCLAFAARAKFMQWRLRRYNAHEQEPRAAVSPPALAVWLWASLAVGLPLVLLWVARSGLAVHGPGAVASFNYAIKLIELPNQLLTGVVVTLVFPLLSKAYARGGDWKTPWRRALLWAGFLSCAAALVLWIAAPFIVHVLFGWGAMSAQGSAQIAQWAAWGAWSLPPQACSAMLTLLLALQQRLRCVALIYAAAVVLLLLMQQAGLQQGHHVMQAWVALWVLIALAQAFALRRQALSHRP